MTTWDEELDRFEASLVEQHRAVAEGRPQDVEAFLPQACGPVPAELVARARRLSEQADALTAELSEATAAAARQLRMVTVMNSSPQPTSSYIDQRG